MSEEIEKNDTKNILFPFKINKDIDILLPKEKRISFQKSFSFLRKKLLIKQSRKTYIDCILKKCKARFFKAIIDCLKKCLKIYIKKFPQSFITNISIENNKPILELTVQDIYKNFNLSYLDISECIKKGLYYKEKEKYIKIFCYSKISDLYLLYIESKRYKREIQYIKDHIGLKMYLLYIFVSENFINYYLFSQPHNNKIIKNNNEEKKISNCYNNLNSIESKKSSIFESEKIMINVNNNIIQIK